MPIVAAPVGGEEFARPSGYQHATVAGNDAARAAHRAREGALLGLMGETVAVVDVDTKNGADIEGTRALLAELGVTTFGEIETPSGGRHFYVAGHRDLPSVSASEGREGLTGYPGVEILSAGRNAFLPGTTRPKYDGKGYRVIADNLAALADGGDEDGAEALTDFVLAHRATTATGEALPTVDVAQIIEAPKGARRRAGAWVESIDFAADARPLASAPDDGKPITLGPVTGTWETGGNGNEGLRAYLAARALRLDATREALGLEPKHAAEYVAAFETVFGRGSKEAAAARRKLRSSLEYAAKRGPALPKDWESIVAEETAKEQLSTTASTTDMMRQARASSPRSIAERLVMLGALLDHLRDWHHLSDPTHVIATLATAVGRHEDDEPCWLLLVAPPSSGKTEVVRIIDDVADARLDEVTAAGLLGWSKGKTVKPSGVLTRVGSRALVTFGDLSTLLAGSDRGGRDQLFALLRRAYDGQTSRDVSPPGKVAEGHPETLSWSGRLTVIGCVTAAIDRYSAHAQELGARWLYIRLPERDTAAKRQAAALARRPGLPDRRREARALAAAALEGVVALPDLPDDIADVIEDAALVTTWGRAAVPRSGYGAREIEGVPVTEEPYRIVRQLGTLTRGVLALGLPEVAACAIARRIALDSMPEARRAVLSALGTGEVLTTAGVARTARLDRKVARMALEDLAAVGVVGNDRRDDEVEAPGSAVHWHLEGEDGTLIAQVFADHRRSGGWDEAWVTPLQGVGRNVGTPREVSSISPPIGGEVEVGTNTSSHPPTSMAEAPCPTCGGQLESTRAAAGLDCLACYRKGVA